MIDGRSEVDTLAGAGGMGTVDRAGDRASGATVALKLLREADPQAAARFAREARVRSGLEHPHIVRCVPTGRHRRGSRSSRVFGEVCCKGKTRSVRKNNTECQRRRSPIYGGRTRPARRASSGLTSRPFDEAESEATSEGTPVLL
ncbi:hypothetical protein [Sorangium sp. So ce1078]|uniref:hypothetical protein n=1 Tax=Sorangium sp. So ce1078 TaxID=3133329 RepID=UPI003F643984